MDLRFRYIIALVIGLTLANCDEQDSPAQKNKNDRLIFSTRVNNDCSMHPDLGDVNCSKISKGHFAFDFKKPLPFFESNHIEMHFDR